MGKKGKQAPLKHTLVLKGQDGKYGLGEPCLSLLVSTEGAVCVCQERSEVYGCAHHIICSDLLVKKYSMTGGCGYHSVITPLG